MNLVQSRVNGQVCKKGIDPLAVCLGECHDINQEHIASFIVQESCEQYFLNFSYYTYK